MATATASALKAKIDDLKGQIAFIKASSAARIADLQAKVDALQALALRLTTQTENDYEALRDAGIIV